MAEDSQVRLTAYRPSATDATDQPLLSDSPTVKTRMKMFFGLEGTGDNEKWDQRVGNLTRKKLQPSAPQPDGVRMANFAGGDEDELDGGISAGRRFRSSYEKQSVFDMAVKGIASTVYAEPRSVRKPEPYSRSIHMSDVMKYRGSVIDAREEVKTDTFFDAYKGAGEEREQSDKDWEGHVKNAGAVRPGKKGWNFKEKKRSRVAPVAAGEDTVDYSADRFYYADDYDDNSNRFVGFMKTCWNEGCIHTCFDVRKRDYNEKPSEQHLYRPYFTWWITFVQTVIFIVAISLYGIAPVDYAKTSVSEEADLILLGARYAPCMRVDPNVQKALAQDKEAENNTACCINNDGSGCLQTHRHTCSRNLAQFTKWTETNPGPDQRTSGSVCGQDPRFCKSSLSHGILKWKDDITEWPICTESSEVSAGDNARHMTCMNTGRPCCYGTQVQCQITTREHCTFLKGFFHEEATLCSQVSCLSDTCGMLPFAHPDRPDQFYRVWSPLFLHAGIFHLLISILYQLFEVRLLEKSFGTLRIIVIYFASGIAGNLASALFLPYHVETGPAGALLGCLGLRFVTLVMKLYGTEAFRETLLKILVMVIFLIVLGFLPFIDNYAYVFGFLVGVFLSFAFLPFATFCRSRLSAFLVGMIVGFGLLVLFVLIFYLAPIYDCEACSYFNCIPFTPDFCSAVSVKIERTIN